MDASWTYWLGRKVYIVLKGQRQYQGKVINVENDSKDIGVYFLTILDKFEHRISFVNSEIQLIQEEGDK